MSTARELGERIKVLVRSGDAWLFNGDKGEHSRDVALRLIDQLVSLAQPGEGALTDERIWEIAEAWGLHHAKDTARGFARDVLAAAGITSTPTGDSNG